MLRFSISLVLVMACDVTSPKKPKSTQVLNPPNSEVESELVGNFEIADKSCGVANESSEIDQVRVHSFSGEIKKIDRAPFAGVQSNDGLKSALVAKAVYGYSSQRQCGNTSGTCLENVTDQGQKLSICRSNAVYSRGSVEGVTLTAQDHMERFKVFYSKLENGQPLEPLSLVILPKITLGANGSTVLANNLAYGQIGNDPSVIIFPKNAFGRSFWPFHQLWESPWVIAHEVGHHVFKTYLTSGAGGLAEFLQPQPVITLPPAPQDKPGAAGERLVGLAESLGAVNEAFADLLAFYSLGESSDYFAGFKCFEKNRDPSHPRFADGQKKVLNRLVLDQFISTTPQVVTSCDQGNFQDVHGLGAVIAHGLYRIYAKSDGNRSRPELLLNFIQGLRNVSLDDRAAQALGQILSQSLKPLSVDGVLTPEQCEVVQEVFSAYKLVGAGSVYQCRSTPPVQNLTFTHKSGQYSRHPERSEGSQ